MSETNYRTDQFSDNEFSGPPKLSTGLNVLTILTIIGCVLGILGTAWNFSQAKKNYDNRADVIAQMDNPKMPAFAKAFLPDREHVEELFVKSYENRIPILLLSLVAYGLCFFGALQMRKMKKQGYLFYVIGELLPFITGALFIGMFSVTGTGAIFGIAISLLFILLYTLQRKNLIY